MKTKILVLAIAAIGYHSAQAETYAPWLTQMGVTETVVSAANWGKGQLIGIVDTGVNAKSSAFAAGQVSTSLSSCAAVSFSCPNGFNDAHGHGTAVAAIAAANQSNPYTNTLKIGGYTLTPGAVIGMAPNANIVAEKVLSDAGKGYTTDVASGIRKAADAGASVINLSVTFTGTADIVAAINYAAAKGAFIVWAGGNNNKDFSGGFNVKGLTAEAIRRLVLVGAVNAANGKASFSNVAGNGQLNDTSGKATSYAARWIMAPGENILAPSPAGGWGLWSGTSMSAPLISGSLALLQNTWPILKTRGTTANLLLATTTDLGATGIDAIYGTGLANLTTAFKPYGTLAVTLANGASMPVNNLTSSMISGGALGSMSAVKKLLTNYQAFDSYTRNYKVNLGGLIQKPATKATLNPLPRNTRTGPNVMKLAEGIELTSEFESAGTVTRRMGLEESNESQAAPMGYMVLTNNLGETVALGYGVSGRYSFAKALYGDSDIALQSAANGEHGVNGLAQGGTLLAYGVPLDASTRFAMTWAGTSSSNAAMPSGTAPKWTSSNAGQFGFGLSHQFDGRHSAGIVVGMLNEKHGLLGSTYDTSSMLSLGNASQTRSVTLLLNSKIDRDNSVQFEHSEAVSRVDAVGNLVANVGSIRARSSSLSWMSKNLLQENDLLTVSAALPLRVVDGSLSMVVPQVDASTGEPSYKRHSANLVPDGKERNFRLSYTTPLGKYRSLGFQATVIKDGSNISGNHMASVGMTYEARF